MKRAIYGITGLLFISVSGSALANSAPAVQVQPPVIETTSHTVVVSETTLYGQQIAAELSGVDKASTFRTLLEQNGLSATLRDKGQGYTAFVPVNSAFSEAAFAAPAPGHINPEIRAVLEDHIVDGKFDVNLLHGQRDEVVALSGRDITISKAGRNFYANGHLITDRMHTPEGIVYFISDVLYSPESRSAVYNPADVRK